MRVDIEVVSPLTAGQTVCDIYHMSRLPKNAIVAKVSIDNPFLITASQICPPFEAEDRLF